MEEKQEEMPENTGNSRNPDGTFKKGISGNPKGKPPGSLSLVAILRQRLELLGPDQKRTIAEHLIDNVMQDALDGKDTQLKLLFNYIEGMPKQAIEHSGQIEEVQKVDEQTQEFIKEFENWRKSKL